MDVVVTVPKRFGLETWIEEGDPAGEPWSGQRWAFYIAGARPAISPGERVYVVYNRQLRGFAPLIELDCYDYHRMALIRGGGAEAVTIADPITGFRGWRYRWWNRDQERAFPNWMTP